MDNMSALRSSCASTSLPAGPTDFPCTCGAESGSEDVLPTVSWSVAPFFGAHGLLSVSETPSRSAKLSLKAGSFGEAGALRDEAGENSKIFLPVRIPIEEA